MSGGVFHIQDDGQLVEMMEQDFELEDELQALLARYPNLMPGNQINPDSPRRWLLVSREMAVPDQEEGADRWSLDHLFLDQDGIPTLVEVKRASDTRTRREVVAQMLDYAANAVTYWALARIRAEFEAHCEQEGLEPQARIAELVQPGESELDVETFWEKVEDNLRAGKVRMIFVADQVPTELQRIVEFLNKQMDPAEVLAVEVKQYVGGTLKTMVPRVIGRLADEHTKPSSGTKPPSWDEGTFFTEMELRQGGTVVGVAHRIMEWAKGRELEVEWRPGATWGNFRLWVNCGRTRQKMFFVYLDGTTQMRFSDLTNPPFDAEPARIELLDRLRKVSGLRLPRDVAKGWLSVPLSSLQDESALRAYLDIWDWFIQRVCASAQR